ncbi:hypothetical protein MKX01_024155 [Papaver californicum]|nr:hypothetical protein MKX01_024155 [Papaver californicum]
MEKTSLLTFMIVLKCRIKKKTKKIYEKWKANKHNTMMKSYNEKKNVAQSRASFPKETRYTARKKTHERLFIKKTYRAKERQTPNSTAL